MTNESKFYKALEEIFVGAKVEGESGYVNLMKIKSRYYEKGVFPKLQSDIEKAVKPFPEFKEELFEKLFTFFESYFSESGSIYFRYTPIHKNIYEKVYTDDKDVVLFWKTHMLYYVKTDRLFKNLEVEIDTNRFFFDVSSLEHKRANEKRDLVHEFKEKKKDGVLVFEVFYSEKGRVTKIDDILRSLKKTDVRIDEEILDRAFRVFEKQSEVDYFINKDAKKFLGDQFDIWLYQYVFTGTSAWTEKRIKQLQMLKDIAFKIIDFISQFEDELVRIWNKPKFVLNSNYVITLDRIADKKLVEKLKKHKNYDEQVKEWEELGIDKDNPKAPIDTKYFKDLELEILSKFEDLDKSLDGWLIKSENYQALNTILPKFKGKVQTIYIDPPFNKEQDADYLYSVKYKDASWISLLENRLQLAKEFLIKSGTIYVKCDYNGDMLVRSLMNEVFGKERFLSEIIWRRFTGTKSQFKSFSLVTDTIYSYAKSETWIYKQQFVPYEKKYLEWFKYEDKRGRYLLRNFYSPGDGPPRNFFGKLIFPPKGHHWRIAQEKIDEYVKEERIVLDENGFPKLKNYLHEMKGRPLDNLIDNIHVVQGVSREYYDFPTQNPEKLIKIFIESSSHANDLILDYFLGSGTTTATAHKLGRKWIGIEMGDHFNVIKDRNDILGGIVIRMKEVLSGVGNHEPCGISKEANWQGGGFFKYFELEQYEDTLRKAKFDDADLFDDKNTNSYSQYVFMKDIKMLDALEIDYKENKVEVDLSKLYSNIDLPETLSNLLGKRIRKITAEYVEFEDGLKMGLKNIDYKIIKPLIWW